MTTGMRYLILVTGFLLLAVIGLTLADECCDIIGDNLPGQESSDPFAEMATWDRCFGVLPEVWLDKSLESTNPDMLVETVQQAIKDSFVSCRALSMCPGKITVMADGVQNECSLMLPETKQE